MSKYKQETVNKVSNLLSRGLNCVEISKELSLHEVTVRRIRVQLKKQYSNNPEVFK